MKDLIVINNKELKIKEFKGKRVVTFKEVDLVHERVDGTANKRFLDNQKYFIKNTDYFELVGDELKAIKRLPNFGIGTNANKSILLTESGYLMLVKSLTDDLAWTVQRELVNTYFRVESVQVQLDTSQLSPELQLFKQIFDAVAKQEIEQKQIKQEITETKQEIKSIKDVVTLNTTDWREETRKLIVSMAQNLGGNEYINTLRKESYELLCKRFNVDLKRRLNNRRSKMAEKGVCKSRREKFNYLDVIQEQNYLIEGYVIVIKDMAIKYGVFIKKN